jgi:exosortase B
MTFKPLPMAAALEPMEHTAGQNVGGGWLLWLPIALGFAALYVPTYMSLARGPWNDEQNAHGPFVLLVVVWLFYRHRAALSALPGKGKLWAGGILLLFGLLLFLIGRAVEVVYFEAFSQIPVVAGLLLVLFGWRGVGVMSFALLYMIFLVPLPGVVIDAATGPLKQLVSVIAENVLYHAGYPIARNGVVLTIGQYQMLVADACSGLNSMYSLSAMGLLFLYIIGTDGWVRKALLLASILPIAFVANILRVVTLVLVTYYFGDEAGQGFVHGFSGILLFVLSMLMLFGLHKFLGKLLPGSKKLAAAS